MKKTKSPKQVTEPEKQLIFEPSNEVDADLKDNSKNDKLKPKKQKWTLKKKLLLSLCILLSTIVVVLIIPNSRHAILNSLGIRSSLVLSFVDENNSPIEQAKVTVDGSSKLTNEIGKVKFNNLKLGEKKVSFSKVGYAKLTTNVQNSLGVTEVEHYKVKITGIEVGLVVKNWLTENLLDGVTASYDSSEATSDSKGVINLVIAPTDEEKVKINLKKDGYLDKVVEVELDTEPDEINMVYAHKNYFISRRAGQNDIYSSNLDGSDQKRIISATGNEESNFISFDIHGNNKKAILVANREGRYINNRAVEELYVIDLEKSTIKKFDEGVSIGLIGWINDSIAYTKTSPTLSYNHPHRESIMVFDTVKNKSTAVATANYFSSHVVYKDQVLYIPNDGYRQRNDQYVTGYNINTNTRRQYAKDSYASYFTMPEYGIIELNNNSFVQLDIESGQIKKLNRSTQSSKNHIVSSNKKTILTIDKRDGQGVILQNSSGSGDQKIVAKIGGLTAPIRFISEDLVIVRVVTAQETADYVVHLPTGKNKKIANVENVSSSQARVWAGY